MNRKQLTLIFLALVILGGAGLVLINRHRDAWSAPQGKMGQKLFPNFPLNDVAAIHVKETNDLHLAAKEGVWQVRERGDYPANYSQIRDLLIKMLGLKISQSEPIAPSQLARMELEPAGKGTNSGTLVEFLDKQGKPIQSLLLGKKHVQQSGNSSPFGGGEYPDGRYLLISNDTRDLILVSDPLESIEVNPESWLDRDFFKIEKLQSVSFVSTNSTNSWKLTRESENAPWVLADTNAGETLDSNKVSSLAGEVSYFSFVDVATNTAPAVTGLDRPLALTLATFDHFTYELKIGRKIPDNNNFYMTVAVSAEIPAQRAAGADEKPEDKQKLDKEFQDKTTALKDKLAKEKAFGSWVYIVGSSLVDPLIRDRSQLFVDKKEETPAAKTGAEPALQPQPGLLEMPGATNPPAAAPIPASAPATTNPPPATNASASKPPE
jgi:hypothetical protein